MDNFKHSIPTVSTQAMALLRFHLGSGGRLVQRIFLPLFGSFIFLIVLLGPDFFISFTAALIGGGYFASAVPTTLFTLIVAGVAGRRLVNGLSGWMRHLPVNQNGGKQIIVMALLLTILPLLALMALVSLAAASQFNIRVVPYLLGLPMVALAAALFVLSTRGRYVSRPLLVMACLCYSSLDWLLMAAGFIFHISANMISGPLVTIKKRMGLSAKRWIHFIFIWRAIRLRLLLPYLLSFMVFPFLFLVLANNPYDSQQANMAIRMASAIMLIMFCAALTHMMAIRRPPWLWSRSLPWSARQRIVWDSLFLVVHILPLMVCILIIRWQIILFACCCLPGLVLISVMASRRQSMSRFGVFGQVFGQTILAVILFVLSPWFSILYLALTPWLLRNAMIEEMTQPVSIWQEVSHLAGGDSQSWRGD